MSASPRAAASIACTSSSGPASFSRNPRAPALSAPWTYSSRSKVVMTTTAMRLVDVGSGELAGGFDAVELGHADVEQAHVGSQPAGQRHRFARRWRPRR